MQPVPFLMFPVGARSTKLFTASAFGLLLPGYAYANCPDCALYSFTAGVILATCVAFFAWRGFMKSGASLLVGSLLAFVVWAATFVTSALLGYLALEGI